MFKLSTVLLGELSQTTIFYKDTNKNTIFDSQDQKVAEIKNAITDTEGFTKLSKELELKSWKDGIIYSDSKYYSGTKQISLAEYNQKIIIHTSIDIISLFIVWFLLWFILFPKKWHSVDSNIVK